jgi:hypothetical protein
VWNCGFGGGLGVFWDFPGLPGGVRLDNVGETRRIGTRVGIEILEVEIAGSLMWIMFEDIDGFENDRSS